MMSSKTIRLEIVTPEKVASQEEVSFVVLPAYEGELGILPGHTDLLAQLSAGELRYEKGGDTSALAVSGGFAEIRSGAVKVFAETAEMSQEIDSERARLAMEAAKKEMSSVKNPQDFAKAQAALRRALIRLKVFEAGARRPKKH